MNSLNRPKFAGTRVSHYVRSLSIITLLATAAMPMLGGSWTAINSGLPGAIQGVVGLTIDPAVPSTLYACTSGGDVFKSMDGAASWKPLGGVGGANLLVLDPQKTSTLYVATRNGIVKSTDGGASWQGQTPAFQAVPSPGWPLTQLRARHSTLPRLAASSRAPMPEQAGVR